LELVLEPEPNYVYKIGPRTRFPVPLMCETGTRTRTNILEIKTLKTRGIIRG
jgi:hypothetical protein